MGAVTNVGVISDTYTINRVLSAGAAPEFAKASILPALVYSEDMPEGMGTAAKAFRSEGAIADPSAVLAEATATSLGTAKADTVSVATAAKAVVAQGVAIEKIKYTMSTLEGYSAAMARAISRFVDDDILDLFPSLTDQVDCAGDVTVDYLDEARLLIEENNCPGMNQNMAVVLSSRGARQLKADIRSSGGSAFMSERFLSIFDGNVQSNGFVGSLPGHDIFSTPSGFTDVSGQNAQAVFHPSYCFAGIFDPSVSMIANLKGVEGLYWELVSYYFWDVVIWNNGAGCELLSSGS